MINQINTFCWDFRIKIKTTKQFVIYRENWQPLLNVLQITSQINLIASNFVPLDSRPNMILIKLSFIATPRIKQLFWVIRVYFINFHALVVVPITLAKQKEHCMKGQLDMLGLTITKLFTNLSTIALVFNICLILHLCFRHFLRYQHPFKTVTNSI